MNRSQLAARIRETVSILASDLDQLKSHQHHWTGQLSTSALSTATAISALSICREQGSQNQQSIAISAEEKYQPEAWNALIDRGSKWLASQQNDDGGFGDTDRSLSNIATTLLAIAAWKLSGHAHRFHQEVERAKQYVERQGSWDGLRRRYGKDKTFVVPIMLNCALAGLIDWKQIPTLPFEAAALPQSWYRLAQLPVVSYAIPALVAIGQAQFVHNPPSNFFVRWLRSASKARTSRVLERMQPESGGYLEAVPLTSFVLMSLASIGQSHCSVSSEARKFIIDSVLEDGSWPIDTNLATWVTSLGSVPYYQLQKTYQQECNQPSPSWDRTIDWLLSCQHTARHPFTGAEPGGWGWTNLSGAVPDADDTPAALLALRAWLDSVLLREKVSGKYGDSEVEQRLARVQESVAMGLQWLVKLQNRDGGWPTFCRGWGTLPFDRSGSDLTAHALRSLAAWRDFPLQLHGKPLPVSRSSIDRAILKGSRYLRTTQLPDGSWLPLWFGNQDRTQEDNPIYGTGRVLLSTTALGPEFQPMFEQGVQYLQSIQNQDGSWGGGPSTKYLANDGNSASGCGTVEETAIALEGIMEGTNKNSREDSILRGLNWLCQAIHLGYHHTSQPIGFYFARLWYYERMYPLVFSLSALNKGLKYCQR